MSGPAIEVHELVVCYGETVAVAGISFEAQAGQIVALLGPNGAGKTSTVETLEGYRRPDSGRVRVLGMDPHKEQRALSRRMGVMLQKSGVYPAMSPREAVRLFARYYDASEEPEGLLFRVGLTSVATTPWRRLSGGEQQRLSLALALVGRPWVAFLDEPTAGVDPQGRLAIREVINDLRAAGTCVLLTTHEMPEAERLADRILILDRGVMVADGTPTELMTQEGGQEIRFGAPEGLDTTALSTAIGLVVDEEWPGEYLVRAEPTASTIAAITVWLAGRDLMLTDLRAGRERLEDVFLRLTGGSDPVPRGPARPAAADAFAPPPQGSGMASRPEAATGGGAAVGRRRRVSAGGQGRGATDGAARPETNSPTGGDPGSTDPADSTSPTGGDPESAAQPDSTSPTGGDPGSTDPADSDSPTGGDPESTDPADSDSPTGGDPGATAPTDAAAQPDSTSPTGDPESTESTGPPDISGPDTSGPDTSGPDTSGEDGA